MSEVNDSKTDEELEKETRSNVVNEESKKENESNEDKISQHDADEPANSNDTFQANEEPAPKYGNDFYGGDYDGTIFGDNAKQYNFFGEKNKFEDSSRERAFPLSKKQYSSDLLLELNSYQHYYHKHNWLIVLRNEANTSDFFELLNELIQGDSNRSYRVKSESIECQDYILYSKELKYEKLTITKVIVSVNSLFFEFFKEPENITELTENLHYCNNILIFVVDSEAMIDIADKLPNYLEEDKREYAIWTPMLAGDYQQPDVKIDELTIVERCILSIAICFNSLPYNLFQNLLAKILEVRAEIIKSTTKKEVYPKWWSKWQQNPDQYFSQLDLANCPMLDEDDSSMRFQQTSTQLFYREIMLNSSMSYLVDLWPKIKELFFQDSGQRIPDKLWQSMLVTELATYLETLHRHGLLSVDASFLMALYEDVRYVKNNDTQYFLRFSYLVKYLYRKSLFKEAVIEYLEQMHHVMKHDEQHLIKNIDYNLEVIRSLPRHMTTLAKMANEETAQQLFLLKDRIYANCTLLDVVLGTNNPLFLSYYVQVFKNDFGKNKINRENLPTIGIYIYYLNNQLANSVTKLIELSVLLQDIDLQEEHNSVFVIARSVLLASFDFKPIRLSSDNVKGLNYLYALLFNEKGVNALVQLLYSKATHTYKDHTKELIYTLIRMRQLLLLQTQEDIELDFSMKRLLELSAESVDNDQYMGLKDMCVDILSTTREMIVNSNNKSEKKELIAYKNACLFIKKAFKRNRGENQ